MKQRICIMKNRYFKGFNHLFGRARKSTAQTLKEPLNEIRGRAPGQLHSLFTEVVEPGKIAGANGSRERHYPADVTFWGMLGEVFRGGSLRDAVREIPAGTTASYTDIANRIGVPKAVRAVARACASNVLAVAIPCHRVVRNDGALSGYRWGVERKRRLLDREAAS